MASIMLEKTRKITKLLEANGPQTIVFSDMCAVLGEVLNSNVYVISKKGKILGLYTRNEKNEENVIRHIGVGQYISEKQKEELLYLKETKANIKPGELKSFKILPESGESPSVTIVPITSAGERMGTLLLDNGDRQFNDDDLILAEYGATVVGMEILRATNQENEIEIRKKTVVQLAIGSLSYSEREAIVNIFKELSGNEGLLVASKVADKAGITRSVIVNALRKFESAGVIESRSLGMKGTHIRILNDRLPEELEQMIQH